MLARTIVLIAVLSKQVNNNPKPYVNGGPVPRGIISINTHSGVVVTDFGVRVKYDGFSTAKIWIPLSYGGCVEGND